MFERLKQWLSKPPRTPMVEMHRVEIVMSADSGQPSKEDTKEMAHEIERRVDQAIRDGEDPATTKAALDEIARRHGAHLEEFDES